MEDLDPKDEDSLEQHGLCYDDAALFVIQKASDEIINSIRKLNENQNFLLLLAIMGQRGIKNIGILHELFCC